jgi:DNA-binding response OmpR family regulator
MNSRLLVVDDDLFLAESLTRLLAAQGYEVATAARAEEAIARIADCAPDMLILDLGLPDVDGVTLCRRIRAEHRFPILMLTSRSEALDKVIGLEVGADDYLTKPFDPQELCARVRAQLRRASEYGGRGKSAVARLGALTIDKEARAASVDGRPLELTDTEYRILDYLMANAGRAISREQLFEHVWGYDIEFNSNSLEVLIYRVRNKITQLGGTHPIKTLRGFGYKLES